MGKNSKSYMEEKMRYLEMIQNVIDRMAGNSFLLKGWSLTIIGVLVMYWFNSTVNDVISIVMILFFIFFFWVYDSFFLRLERAYRNMFNEVRISDSKVTFDLTPYPKYMPSFFTVLLSKTKLWTYGLILVLFIIMILFKNIESIQVILK